MSSTISESVIAVCIEVASPEMLKDWLRRGWMPNLDRLCQNGAWSRLESVSELSSGSIWPTFFTGVNPAKHGQFFTHMQIEPGTYEIVKKYADDVLYDPFWIELHRSGKSSAIIDVPQTRPLKDFRGIHIAGWGGEYPAWPRSSSPASLMPRILKRFGTHPLAGKYRVAHRPENQEQSRILAHKLLSGAQKKANLSRWLFNMRPHDLFLTVFSEPHWAMHLFWDVLDEDHPYRNEDLALGNKDIFRDIFNKIDQTIGELQEARPNADLLVFSLSGMGPNYSGWHILSKVLERIGMGSKEKNNRGLKAFLPMPRWGSWKTRALEDIVSLRIIETAKSVFPKRLWDKWTRKILYAGCGWNRSRAFCVPNDYSGAIRINLEGREPNGLVAPGREYDAVCDEITETLMELVHLETGNPLVREVIQTKKVYAGENIEVLPDLLVLWMNETLITGAYSPRIGTINIDFPEQRTGAHRTEGFLIASGHRICKGKVLEKIHLMDLAPTILHLLDVKAPEHYEGRVISELIE